MSWSMTPMLQLILDGRQKSLEFQKLPLVYFSLCWSRLSLSRPLTLVYPIMTSGDPFLPSFPSPFGSVSFRTIWPRKFLFISLSSIHVLLSFRPVHVPVTRRVLTLDEDHPCCKKLHTCVRSLQVIEVYVPYRVDYFCRGRFCVVLRTNFYGMSYLRFDLYVLHVSIHLRFGLSPRTLFGSFPSLVPRPFLLHHSF